MSDWPKLYILFLTYSESINGPRAGYARETLRSTLQNLRYSGQISVHIADDGSPEEYREELVRLAGGYDQVHGVTTTNSQRRGYGASYNLATQVTHSFANIILPLEDDWRLAHPLDVDCYIRALITGRIGCIRLGYLGFTQKLSAEIGTCEGKTYLLFDSDSPERHVCAGHPRIETVEWERSVGPWPEGHDPGTTEFLWCGLPAARRGVAWPLDTPDGGWYHHIGAQQARLDQREEVAV